MYIVEVRSRYLAIDCIGHPYWTEWSPWDSSRLPGNEPRDKYDCDEDAMFYYPDYEDETNVETEYRIVEVDHADT